ncbi:integral membrane protein [Mycolicibacterium neworleansense]|uniref:Integral membrane protein n=2 Tax=Mycolicibacterium neworleansense TaxID=146018 RepID=A0A0H5S908_9MYCO|nr:integral membrane protein [Mycolicibacterium neworleansense]
MEPMTSGRPHLAHFSAGSVIPLRPLSLTDIFNGAVAYIRTNPRATLGLATVVVLASQIISLALQVGPLSALGEFDSTVQGEAPSAGTIVVFAGGVFTGIVVTTLSSLLLSGMLTVVIGRSVFGGSITVGEAWQRLRGRLPALIGLTVLQAIALILVAAGVTVLIVGADALGGGLAAFAIGAVSVPLALVAVLYASTVLLFSPAVIVLEQRGIIAAVKRSFVLVNKDFWRVFGIWLLATIVAGVIGWGVGAPFNVAGQIMSMVDEGPTVPALILTAVGAAIGQIVTAPFSAGVVVLLYADRRFRAEAFDLMLQTGADAPVETADQLWLPRYI